MGHYVDCPNRGNKYCCQIIIPMKYRSRPPCFQKGKVGRVLDGLMTNMTRSKHESKAAPSYPAHGQPWPDSRTTNPFCSIGSNSSDAWVKKTIRSWPRHVCFDGKSNINHAFTQIIKSNTHMF